MGKYSQIIKEKIEQIYNIAIKEKVRDRVTLEYFKTSITPEGLMNRMFMKVDVGTLAEQVEQLLSPERAEESAGKMESVMSPADPAYPSEKKVYHPYAEDLEKLENQIAENDPDAARKKDLLSRAAGQLVYVTQEHLDYLDMAEENGKTYFVGEQGIKMYGFWPIATAFYCQKPYAAIPAAAERQMKRIGDILPFRILPEPK